MYKRLGKITSSRTRPPVCSEFISLIHLCFGDLAMNARDITWTGSHHALLAFACQVSTAMFWEQFRSVCLNHFNLPLLFLQLEAVIAEVRKYGPMTQGSPDKFLSSREAPKHVVRYRFSKLFVPQLARLSCETTAVHYLQFIILTKCEECGCESTNNSTPGAFSFFPLYIKTDKINPNANCRA